MFHDSSRRQNQHRSKLTAVGITLRGAVLRAGAVEKGTRRRQDAGWICL